MASQKQIQANRQNAQKSTGPKSPVGKSTVAQNAIKHGLRSNRVLIASDDPSEFESHQNALFEDLAPVGPMETFLANRIVKLTWQLSRVTRLQSESMDTLACPETNALPEQPAEYIPPWVTYDDEFLRKIGILSRDKYDQLIDDGILDSYIENWVRQHQAEFKQFLKDSNDEYNGRPAPESINQSEQGPLSLGQLAVSDFANTRVLERLLMYERRIENSLYKTHLELQRLQLLRLKKESQTLKTEG